jgi:hypothetical protein
MAGQAGAASFKAQNGTNMTEHIGADNTHTRRIAEFVSSLSYERIPQAVRERTSRRQAALIDAVLNLEKLSDAKQLARLLRVAGKPDGGSGGA